MERAKAETGAEVEAEEVAGVGTRTGAKAGTETEAEVEAYIGVQDSSLKLSNHLESPCITSVKLQAHVLCGVKDL